jgi:hypothetical protein
VILSLQMQDRFGLETITLLRVCAFVAPSGHFDAVVLVALPVNVSVLFCHGSPALSREFLGRMAANLGAGGATGGGGGASIMM